MLFYLNNYTRTADVVAAINKISYGGYAPDIPAALSLVRREIFSPVNGARGHGVLRLAVLVVTETLLRYCSKGCKKLFFLTKSSLRWLFVFCRVSGFRFFCGGGLKVKPFSSEKKTGPT